MQQRAFLCLIPLGLLGAVLFVQPRPAAAESQPGPVDFNRDIRPTLPKTCFACHGQDGNARASNLRLDHRDSAVLKAKDGTAAIIPGSAEQSELVKRITAK